MNKVYLLCYSTEEGTYTSHIAFATRSLAEEKRNELVKEDGLDWYVVDVPLVTTEETGSEHKTEVMLKDTAQCISEVLSDCRFDDVTDSSGYYVVKEFDDGTNRAVDVYKANNDGNPHYVVYCSYEDEDFDYKYTETLSVEELTRVLEEFYAE